MMELQDKPKNLTDNINIYYTMRSLYRYCKLIDLNAPNTLLEMEFKLLRDRIIDLSNKEIDTLVEMWFEFSDRQKIQDEIEDIELDKELDDFFMTLN